MHASISASQESESYPGADYFSYLARCFPVMCASDEFHFLPRAVQATNFYDRMDRLDAKSLNGIIVQLNEFKKFFSVKATSAQDLEEKIDYKLLQSNAAGAIIELEQNQSWRRNPLLYLKIACIGIDHALNKPAVSNAERHVRTRARLSSVPRLLQQATDNIDHIPRAYYDASLNMIHDTRRYMKWLAQDAKLADMQIEFDRALRALDKFNRFVQSIKPRPDAACAVPSLDASLAEHFLISLSTDEIFQRAQEQWFFNLEKLSDLAAQIDPLKSWQQLYHDFTPADGSGLDTLSLYRNEVEKLVEFFSNNGFRPQDLEAALEIAATPLYLQSVRSSASFSAALTADQGEQSFFYITVPKPSHGQSDDGLLQQRLHREYKYLTAHETIPGHHVLDSFRRRSINPIRQQIESPLFYEGWATYVETLLTERGYITRPIEILVDYKRRLWRCARCMIDVGLPTKRLTKGAAHDLLIEVGFSETEAESQVARFQLNPGYQLCYFLGRSEILRLREIYAKHHANDRFHAFMLEGGQLPFELIEQRIIPNTV